MYGGDGESGKIPGARAMTQSLGELVLDAAAVFGDDVAFEARRGYRRERLTFRQVGELGRRTAGWLAARGLEAGDRLVIWSPNMPEYAVLFLGAWLAGAVVVPIDVRTKQDVLERFVIAARPHRHDRPGEIRASDGYPRRGYLPRGVHVPRPS
jgi:long-chain acyl-CoA synthetase